MAELLDAIDKQTHAGVALVVAAAIDRLLEDGLETRLTVPNRDFREKLFGDFGVLSGFSAKIDLSLALGVLDKDSYVHATALRKIRNLFAHSHGDFLHFSMPDIQALLPPSYRSSAFKSATEGFIAMAASLEETIVRLAELPSENVIARIESER